MVLETPAGESPILPHTRSLVRQRRRGNSRHYPEGEVRYTVDHDETLKRLEEAIDLRVSWPKANEGDIEL